VTPLNAARATESDDNSLLVAESGRAGHTAVRPVQANPKVAKETKYLTFQFFTRGPAGPAVQTKAQIGAFLREVVKAIGTTGDVKNKLGFSVGPLCFDMLWLMPRTTRQNWDNL